MAIFCSPFLRQNASFGRISAQFLYQFGDLRRYTEGELSSSVSLAISVQVLSQVGEKALFCAQVGEISLPVLATFVVNLKGNLPRNFPMKMASFQRVVLVKKIRLGAFGR